MHQACRRNTERCKEHFEAVLKNHRLRCESMQQYPNLIFFKNKTIQIVCPDTRNPRWIAVNHHTFNNVPADYYVAYTLQDTGLKLVGFAYRNCLVHYPVGRGFKDPTNRIPIGNLQDITALLEELVTPIVYV